MRLLRMADIQYRWQLIIPTLFLLGTSPFALAASKPVPGQAIFSPPQMQVIKIEISDEGIETLRKVPREYVPGTIKLNGKVLKKCGIRLKGRSTFEPIDKRPSFTIKFNEYTSGQKYHGLSKVHLHNAKKDPTLLREHLAYQFYRDAGVSASRTTYARIELNGRDLGFYVFVEGINKVFLKLHFESSKGNLYEALHQDIDEMLEQDNGVYKDQRDRIALVVAASILDPKERWEALQAILEVEKFISFLAVETLICHLDNYWNNKNNYRIYNDPKTGKFTFIPHGVDQAFAYWEVPLTPHMRHIMTRAVLTTDEGRKGFRTKLQKLLKEQYNIDSFQNERENIHKFLKSEGSYEEIKNLSDSQEDFFEMLEKSHKWLSEHLNRPSPQFPDFDENGVAELSGWEPRLINRSALMDKPVIDGKRILHIAKTKGACFASWRTRVLLAPGRYRFVGVAKTKEVSPRGGAGNAGARLYAYGEKNSNRLLGNTDWTKLSHEIEIVSGNTEILMVAELRAIGGEVWFDRKSLKIFKLQRNEYLSPCSVNTRNTK